MTRKFDVIIPTYNNLQELKECLDGFAKQTFRDFRVIVCVDGSTDGTNEYLESSRYEFGLLKLNHPGNVHKGRNKTRNLSLDKISAKYILLFDSDIVPNNDLLQKHFELLEKMDCISVGEIIYENKDDNLWTFYLQTRGKGKYRAYSEIPGYYLNTQNVAFNSDHFLKLEGLDSELSPGYGGDDTILGYRIDKEINIPVLFNQAAAGYCYQNKSLEKALKQMEEFGAVNLKVIKKKYPSFKHLFRFDIAESNLLHHKIIRLFLREWIAKVLLRLIKIFPKKIKIKAVHFLVFFSIYKGYNSKTLT